MGHNEDIMSTWKGVCDVLHRIRDKFFDAIYVETPFNPVNVF